MRGKSMILIVIALGCGLVASIGISKILDRQKDGQQKAQSTKKVYVAVRDVDISEVFDANAIKLEEWPADKVPEGAAEKMEDVVGLAPNQRLYAGEVIRKEKLVDPATAAGRAFLIPKGYRVQAIKVSSDSSVGNIVRPGDHVDVQVYLRKGTSIPQATTKTILEDVRVFAVNAETEKQVDDKGQKISAKTVSLLVKPEQLQTLLLASQLGSISLSLRHPDDNLETVADNGSSINDLINGTAQDGTPKNDVPTTAATTEAATKARDDFSNFLANLTPSTSSTASAQSEQVVSTEFKMQMLTPEGITTFSLIDDAEFSAAQELSASAAGASNAFSFPATAPARPATTLPVTAPEQEPTAEPADVSPEQLADPDYTPADDTDSAGGDDSTADTDNDA